MVGSVRSGFAIAPLERMLWLTSRPCQLPSEGPSWEPERAYARAIPMQKQYSPTCRLLDFWSACEAAQDEDPSNLRLSGLQVPVSIAPRGDLVCAS